MQKTTLLTTTLLSALLLSGTAHAAERWPNWYVGLTGSVGFLQDADVSGTGIGTTTGIDYDAGWGAGASLGYLPPGWTYLRMEGEIFYHHNEANELHTTGASVPATGSIAATSYMFNLFYDVPTGWAFSPYIGGGIGATTVDVSSGSFGNTSDTKTRVSYQGMAGLSFLPSSIPDTEWTIGYRYLGVSKPTFTTAGGAAKIDYNLHNIEAGVKFRF